MKLIVKTSQKEYPIYIERNAIQHINDYFETNRNVFILSDEGIPTALLETIKNQCQQNVYVHVVPQGEQSKSFSTYESTIHAMMKQNIGRCDVLVAVGGGVIGDLGGFVSSTYMRGISFVNIPTTTLSQIDSSIGGKVAINVGLMKNIVGAFYPPDCVLIDPTTLSTLPIRHYHNGLVEALKAGLLRSPKLVARFEKNDIDGQIDDIIYEALLIKKEIVEADEFEQGERKLLNLGHTIGHALESHYQLQGLLHGEAVALGILPMIQNKQLKDRVKRIYQSLSLKNVLDIDATCLYQYIVHDKKKHGQQLDIIILDEVCQPCIRSIPIEEIKPYLDAFHTTAMTSIESAPLDRNGESL